VFRYVCEFEVFGTIQSGATFPRLISRLEEKELLYLISKVEVDQIIDLGFVE
jgi:transposase